MIKDTDIAITGMSALFPGAANMDEYWHNIINKKDAVQQVPASRIDAAYFHDRQDGFYCDRGGFIDGLAQFDPLEFGILPLATEGTEPEQLLALSLAAKALQDAGVAPGENILQKTSIIIGKGNYTGPAATNVIEIVRTGEQVTKLLQQLVPGIATETLDRVKAEFIQQKNRYCADTAMGLIPNLVASLVANRLNLGGAAYTIDAACASSLIAIDHAVQELQHGRADMVIAGGVHAGQNAPFWSIFTKLGALSKSKQIKPFDQQADGLLIGEGCGFVVLKRYADAVQNGDRIYAVVKGVGVSSDGAGTSVMSPSVKGQQRAVEQAWRNAALDPQQVGYIEAHGTGTPLGDRTELQTLAAIFGNGAGLPHAGIGSVKSMIGHAMPAAGIAGVIKTALALYHEMLPPTLHCSQPLPQMLETRFRPVQDAAGWNETGLPKIAGVNAFGFGGINAHVVLQGADTIHSTKNTYKYNNIRNEKDAVLVLARSSSDALLEALQNNERSIGINLI